MKEKIAITGSKGTIGTVLTKGLSPEFEITELSLPEVDVRSIEQVKEKLQGNFAVIHLAWNSKTENHVNNEIDPDCAKMFLNVYKAAVEVKVPRVIMASSVHADTFIGWSRPGLLSVDHPPIPDSLYGADKLFMEACGRFYATKGLEVVCIRFGGVNPKNSPAGSEYPAEERAAWLSHNDLVSLIKAILEAPSIPNNFVLMYAVSDNHGRVMTFQIPSAGLLKRDQDWYNGFMAKRKIQPFGYYFKYLDNIDKGVRDSKEFGSILILSLVEEVGEMSRAYLAEHGRKATNLAAQADETYKQELGDILVSILRLARIKKINLNDAMMYSLRKIEKRKKEPKR